MSKTHIGDVLIEKMEGGGGKRTPDKGKELKGRRDQEKPIRRTSGIHRSFSPGSGDRARIGAGEASVLQLTGQ